VPLEWRLCRACGVFFLAGSVDIALYPAYSMSCYLVGLAAGCWVWERFVEAEGGRKNWAKQRQGPNVALHIFAIIPML